MAQDSEEVNMAKDVGTTEEQFLRLYISKHLGCPSACVSMSSVDEADSYSFSLSADGLRASVLVTREELVSAEFPEVMVAEKLMAAAEGK